MIIQILLISLIIGGGSLREYFRIIPQHYFTWVDERKWMLGISIFLVGNILQSNLASSGAFEVLMNNKLVQSHFYFLIFKIRFGQS